MTREEEIIELTKRTCNAYRRQEPLDRTCGGFQECDCKCLQYNRCEAVYDAGWRKQIAAEWKPYTEYYADDYSECNTRRVWSCSRCGRLEKYKEPYCNCGAKMREDNK